MSQVADGVHLVHGSNTNWVILTEGDAVTLVDTGYPGDREKVLESLSAVGSSPEAVAAVLITHAHNDHLGSEGADGLSVYQRVTAGRYAYLTVGEHLVSGPRTPAEFVEYCLSGEQSRSTLHDPAFTETGVTYVPDSRPGTLYWTAL